MFVCKYLTIPCSFDDEINFELDVLHLSVQVFCKTKFQSETHWKYTACVLGLHKTHIFFLYNSLNINANDFRTYRPRWWLYTIYYVNDKGFPDRGNVRNIRYYLWTRYVSNKNENILLNLWVTCLLVFFRCFEYLILC